MMKYVPGIEPQPHFPVEDISEANADLLELLLANQELVRQGHEESEKLSWVFKVGHPVTLRSMSRIYDIDEYGEAIDHGVASFETMSLMLCSMPESRYDFTVNANGAALTTGINNANLRSYAEIAFESFRSGMPRTAEVISTSSRRFYGAMTQYALLGAAIARQFELDSAA